MKIIPLILFSILFLANTVLAQDDCSEIGATSINVIGPASIVPIGESMTFIANPIFTDNSIKENSNYKIEYHWIISNGNIIDGQGTPNLKVVQPPENAGETLTVTITVKILPTSCTLTGSSSAETICFFGKMSSTKIDELSTVPPQINKERLESIHIELKNDPTSQTYISETFNKTVKPDIIKKKLSNLFSYLTKNLGIDPRRISLQFTVGEENLTELWIIMAGADMPDSYAAERIIKGDNFQQDIEKFFPKVPKKSLHKKVKKK